MVRFKYLFLGNFEVKFCEFLSPESVKLVRFKYLLPGNFKAKFSEIPDSESVKWSGLILNFGTQGIMVKTSQK